ncbi:MAG: hypothetical protein JO132_21025 [Streptosporangiaceae bacterium]|nr:hypothetical protein [Streptosporangiaceae bacterium]
MMVPLFGVPGDADPGRPSRRRGARPPGRARRDGARLPTGRTGRAMPGESGADHADLLAVTAQRLRRALARSFLRHGISADLETAVHAAMNVIEPVLQARDTEIGRLRNLTAVKAVRVGR